MRELPTIAELSSTVYGITIKLSNGVTIGVNPSWDYLHLSFSGIDEPIEIKEPRADNYINISYSPSKK